jgi:uncharacterized damage-inducible protein DinB
MKAHFVMMANYNRWANARVYKMASALPDADYRRDVGAYFKSLHGTLNHLLAADRIWMHRLTKVGEHPARLDAIISEDLPTLSIARADEDKRIQEYIQALDESSLDQAVSYRTLSGVAQQQGLRDILAHVFNHETHHRGQAHAILTILGVAEPEPLDLLIMQRTGQ